MRKEFPCGHKGKGAYCHRCANELKQREQAAQAKDRTREEKSRLKAADPIDLSLLDHQASLQTTARTIIQAMSDGGDYRTFGGKGLEVTGGRVVSVPVGRKFRLLFDAETRTPIALHTHESYNNLVSNPKRLRP